MHKVWALRIAAESWKMRALVDHGLGRRPEISRSRCIQDLRLGVFG